MRISAFFLVILAYAGIAQAASPWRLVVVSPEAGARLQATAEVSPFWRAPDLWLAAVRTSEPLPPEAQLLGLCNPERSYALATVFADGPLLRHGESALWRNRHAALVEGPQLLPLQRRLMGCNHRLAVDPLRPMPPPRGPVVQGPDLDRLAPVLGSVAESIGIAKLRRHLEGLEAPSSRYSFAPGIEDALITAENALQRAGFSVERMAYAPGYPKQLTATLPGESQREIILIAHLDSISPLPQTAAPGMNDNGSSVAMWLAAAEALGSYAPGFGNTVRIVLTTGEEQGLVGAEGYVAQRDIRDTIAVFNSEMIGNPGQGPQQVIEVIHNGVSRSFAETAAECIRRFGQAPSLAVEMPWLTASDHAPFWRAGVPGIISTSDFPPTDPHYHQTSDVLAALDLNQILAVARGMTAAAFAYARPRVPAVRMAGFGTTNLSSTGPSALEFVAIASPGASTLEIAYEGAGIALLAPPSADGLMRAVLGEVTGPQGRYPLSLRSQEGDEYWPTLSVGP